MDMRESIRKSLKVQESVATTIYHEFYGSRTGINNRIPICPFCQKPRTGGIYDNEFALTNGMCECDPKNPNASK